MTSLGALVRAHGAFVSGRRASLIVSDRWFETAPDELLEYIAGGRLLLDVRAALDAGVIDFFQVTRDGARAETRYEWVAATGVRP